MTYSNMLALAFIILFFSPMVDAQNKVVVIPLMGDEPTKTELAFSRISTQCQSGEHVFLEGLSDDVTSGTPSFYLDDSESSNPFISAVNNGPTLPDTTSRIDIFVRANENFLDAEINVANSSVNTSFLSDLNDCSSPTESMPFASGGIENTSQSVISITGKTWLVTSNLTVRDGVMTLGPTLFRLSQ